MAKTQTEYGPLGYSPNTPAAIIFGLAFAIPAIHATWLMRSGSSRYMLTLIISGYIYAIGLALRIPVGNNPSSLNLFIIMNLCTVLSPCGFIATVYVLLGRLALYLRAEELLMIRPNILTKVYVTSDVVTLLVQAGGASLAISKDESTRKMSTKIFLIGLILQLVSFATYLVVFGVFVNRVKSERTHEWDSAGAGKLRSWRRLITAIVVSCVGVTIRCIYRTIEGGQGHGGYLATHEVYFYVLDCLPLLGAVMIYNFIWPPAALGGATEAQGIELLNNRRAENA